MDTNYKLALKVLINSENHVLHEVPSGKLNPKQECLESYLVEDKRDRVLQTAQKGATCGESAFDLMRFRVGKFPDKSLQFSREIEKLCSDRIKHINKFDKSLSIPMSLFFNESFISILKEINETSAKKIIENKELCSEFDVICQKHKYPSVVPFIEDFLKENKFKSFYEYLLNKRCGAIIKINETFLSCLKILNVDVCADQFFAHEKWKEFTLVEQTVALNTFVRDAYANVYGIKKSAWRPKNGIDELLKELKDKKVLCVSGTFGKDFYIDPPYKLRDQVGGHDIYAWKSGSQRVDFAMGDFKAGHVILLVGAKKTKESAIVYFIDCNDDSRPNEPRRKYAMSIDNLTRNIFDIVGEKKSEYYHAYYSNFVLDDK